MCAKLPAFASSRSGELDLESSDGLPDTLNDIAGTKVIVDLAELSFVNSSGIRAFVRARQRREEQGSSLVLTLGPSRQDS
jgi:anti-anti-sigma factor